MIKRILLKILYFSLLTSKLAFGQSVPYINEVDQINFGRILGLIGTCHLDYDTREITDLGGGLCPNKDNPTGQPGKYLLVGNPNTTIRIRISGKPYEADGLTYMPEGVFSVNGQPDVNIIEDQYQDINTGSTGIIIIKLGGTITTITQKSFNTDYSVTVTDMISFDELP